MTSQSPEVRDWSMSALLLGWNRTEGETGGGGGGGGAFAGSYQRRGHGDVEELPSAALRDGPGEEKLVPLVGEERSFVLRGWRAAA